MSLIVSSVEEALGDRDMASRTRATTMEREQCKTTVSSEKIHICKHLQTYTPNKTRKHSPYSGYICNVGFQLGKMLFLFLVEEVLFSTLLYACRAFNKGLKFFSSCEVVLVIIFVSQA